MITIEEIKDRLIARYSPEDIIEQLQPDIESVVEGLHEWIVMNLPAVLEMVDYKDEEDEHT